MPEKKNDLTVFSPAKVNLHLKVKDRRPDGFHDIESVFLAVNFGDTLHFSLPEASPQTQNGGGEDSNSTEISVCGLGLKDNEFLSMPQNNIIFKAITLFRENTGFSRRLKVRAEKRIPPGGGLGGGSSNAAISLLSLNKMAGSPCSREALLEMAGSLGSDVSFFIYETCSALVTGRGDCIKPLDSMPFFLVLVNPGFPSDTARAFCLLDEYRKNTSINSQKILNENRKFLLTNENIPDNSSAPARICEIKKQDHSAEINIGAVYPQPKTLEPVFFNDFLPVFPEPEKSIYGKIISNLKDSGALYASLSGTGSTCFGVFNGEEAAKRAAESLRASDNSWFVECCGTLFNRE